MDQRAALALEYMKQAMVLLDEIPKYDVAARLQGAIDTLTGQARPMGPIDPAGDPSLH